ncbi:hypothetical protein ACVI1J_000897 [Bradyrhizobium diazoefficiens]
MTATAKSKARTHDDRAPQIQRRHHQFRSPPHRPVGARRRRDAGDRRRQKRRRADGGDAAGLDPAGRPARSRQAAERDRGDRAYGRARCPKPSLHLADRPRLFRHDPARGDPAQHPGESGLVHGLHALPARDQPGPAGGAVQLPDHDLRPYRARRRQRLAARRGHRGRRGDGAGGAALAGRSKGLLRRQGRASADAGGDAHPRRAAGLEFDRRRSPHRSRQGRRARRAAAISGLIGRVARPQARDRGVEGQGRTCDRCRRPAGTDTARLARRARCRHRHRFGAALRRADGIRRTARGLHGGARCAEALAARSHRRSLRGFARDAGLSPRAADPRAAHPPREGDLQHLHRAGAARRDRRDVCGLSRPRGAFADRTPGASPRRRARRGPAQARLCAAV